MKWTIIIISITLILCSCDNDTLCPTCPEEALESSCPDDEECYFWPYPDTPFGDPYPVLTGNNHTAIKFEISDDNQSLFKFVYSIL